MPSFYLFDAIKQMNIYFLVYNKQNNTQVFVKYEKFFALKPDSAVTNSCILSNQCITGILYISISATFPKISLSFHFVS